MREPKKIMSIVLDEVTLSQAGDIWAAIQEVFENYGIESEGGFDLIDKSEIL